MNTQPLDLSPDSVADAISKANLSDDEQEIASMIQTMTEMLHLSKTSKTTAKRDYYRKKYIKVRGRAVTAIKLIGGLK